MDRETKSLLILGNLVYLLIGFIQFETIDWLIQWHTATEIVSGLPFYHQTTRIINGESIWIANHPPVFFYSFAIWVAIVGSSMYLARIFMFLWFLAIEITLIEIIRPKTDREWKLLIFLFFLNPHSFLVLVLGLFDFVVILYTLLAIYYCHEERPVISAITLSAGILTKTYPLLLMMPLALSLVKKGKVRASLIFAGLTTILSVGLYSILFAVYGPVFIERAILFQFGRASVNTSIWFLLLGHKYTIAHKIIQLVLLVLTYGFIWKYPLTRSLEDLLAANSVVLVVFILLLKTSYPHYTIWYAILLVFPVWKLLQGPHYSWGLFLAGSVLLNFLGFSVCIVSCFDSPNNPFGLLVLQNTIHFLGHLGSLVGIIQISRLNYPHLRSPRDRTSTTQSADMEA